MFPKRINFPQDALEAQHTTQRLVFVISDHAADCGVQDAGELTSTLCSHNLHVQVSQATGSGQGQLDHALHRHRVAVQVVEQGAVLMVVRYQPQLRPRPIV